MEQSNITPIANDEIDLLALAKTLWLGRKTILLSILVGSILGIAVAILTPNEYTGGKIPSGLSNLASLAGVDLGMAESSELSPVIYPKIVSSIPFKLELMNTPVNFSTFDKPITLYNYYTKKQKPTFKIS